MSEEDMVKTDVEIAIDEAESDMNKDEKGLFKKIKNALGSIKNTGRAGVLTVNAIKLMTRATAYSQEAAKICIAIDKKSRKPEDFRVAAKVVGRGQKLIAEVLKDFPTTWSVIMPLRDKMDAQMMEIKERAKAEFGIDVEG